MKKMIALIIIFVFSITGCSTLGGLKTVDPNYQAYTATIQAQLTAAQKPLVDIKVDKDGRISAITMNQPPRHIAVEQKNPHPVWGVTTSLIRACGVVGGIWATGEALEGVIEAASGNTTNMNSFNNNSENAGSIDSTSDYATQRTETSTATADVTATSE